MARPVFLSFHYKRDVSRVQLIRNIGAVEGQSLVNPQEWESLKRRGPSQVENWIDQQMKYKQAVVVLIGQETASRPWVQYEIRKAHRENRPMLGVYIHNLSSFGAIDRKGPNPFLNLGIGGVAVHTPSGLTSPAVYANIVTYLPGWIEAAIAAKRR